MPPSPPKGVECKWTSAPQRRPGPCAIATSMSATVAAPMSTRWNTSSKAPLGDDLQCARVSAQADWLLADRSIEGHRPIDHHIGGFIAADDLHEETRVGGLNGWPSMIRSGKREFACTGVIGKPDELDARTTSARNIASSR